MIRVRLRLSQEYHKNHLFSIKEHMILICSISDVNLDHLIKGLLQDLCTVKLLFSTP